MTILLGRRLRTTRRASVACALLGALLVPTRAWAQSPPEDAGAPPAPAPALLPPAAPDPVEEKLRKQQEQIDQLIAHGKAQDETLQAVKEQAASAAEETSTPSKLLSFWGYADLNFGGMAYDDKNALYKLQTPSNPTFFSSGINLYFKSEMTRTLSALVETRLTYTPHGYASDWPTEVNVGTTTIQKGGELDRVDTATRGPYSQLLYRQSGILIERAYLEWKPKDWFGVRAGRFLTPFGIWNEDHGSPVLIGVDYPQFMNFRLVPIWQLGAQVFGSANLADDLRMEYALTVANSRGPHDEYKDLTAMKAFGARAKLVYNPEPFLFRLGGYAYFNNYKNTSDTVRVQLGQDLRLDPAYRASFGSYTTVRTDYDETIMTLDAEFRVQKLRLIGEFVRQTVAYNVPSKVGSEDKLLKGVAHNETIYDPNHYGLGGYVMAAYEVPIRTSALDFSVTPYAGYDYIVPSTTVPVKSNTQVRGGINVKPSPYVTLKLEVSRVLPENKSVASEATAVMSQLAFSF